MQQTQVFLSLGSNIGKREEMLVNASSSIQKKAGRIIRQSSVYETAPWGNRNQDAFLNQVLEITTVLSPESLLAVILGIEAFLGRIRTEKRWTPRTIDIDILFYGQRELNSRELHIPHPELHLRKFVLIPLTEIAPELRHPVLGKTIREILQSCPDDLIPRLI